MNKEDLVTEVVAEVMRRLAPLQAKESVSTHQQVLAIFTGGTTGLTQSLAELKKMQATGSKLSIILSETEEKMIPIQTIQEYLGSHIDLVTSDCPYPRRLLEAADLVLVPVLTRNTAAKIAHNVADTLPSNLITQALLMGKPVVAAKDAAQGQRYWGKCLPPLVEALQDNLKKLSAYGIQLVNAEELAGSSQSRIDSKDQTPCPLEQHALPRTSQQKKSVLDAEMIKAAAGKGLSSITVMQNTIITPLAKDVAREYGIAIVQEARA